MSLFPPTKTRVTHNTGTPVKNSLVPSLKKPTVSPSIPAPIKPQSRCASCGKHKF